jgi:hypothetical protein
MTLQEATHLIDAVARYAYNAEFKEFAELYDTQDEDYLLGKYKLLQKDVGHFLGQLDEQHRGRFVRLVIDRYKKRSGTALQVTA